MGRFDDKVIIITGGGSGLGRACAELWAAEGGTIVIADINEARAKEAADAIESGGGCATGIKVDVSVESDLASAVEHTIGTYGRLDVMFANAGRAVEGLGTIRLEDVTEDQWDAVNDVILKGVFFSGKHAARVMRGQGGGNIVVTVSAAGLAAYPGFGPYNAGKAGVVGLIKSMAYDWGCYGIRVNGLAPTHGMPVTFVKPPDAAVEIQSYEEAKAAEVGGWDARTMFPGPLKMTRPPRVRDNANVATFLASDDSEYMSGVVIPSCDGGTFARTSIPIREEWVAGG